MTRASEGSISEEVLRARNLILSQLARGTSVAEVLEGLVRSAEEMVAGLRCSILLLRDNRLYLLTAPSLPEFYNAAVEGIEIGRGVGSCGEAAYTAERVIVRDVATHPNWASFRDETRRAGIRASWSEPILSPVGDVLGTFAMYYGEPKEPGEFELEFIHSTAQVAGVWIERERNEQALERAREELERRVEERTESLSDALSRLEREVADRKLAEAELRASDQRFRELADHIDEVFWLATADRPQVLYVSPAYARVWKREPEDLLRNANQWLEAIHPDDLPEVEAEWQAFVRGGTYDCEYRIIHPDGTARWVHDRGFPVHDEDGKLVRLAGVAKDVTERKLAQESLALHREQLRSLTSELVLAEERERRKLAVDLHDGLNQTITLALMKLAALRKLTGGDVSEQVNAIEELVAQANGSARSLTFQLSPPVLHDLGLWAAVQWLVEDVQSTYGIQVRLVGPEVHPALDERARVILFRAVRELLINVAKHANARQTEVEFEVELGWLRIEVRDDGDSTGGPVGEGREGGEGFGLFGIRERLSYIGGKMEIEAARGRGTLVRLCAPLDAASEEGSHT